jgi:prephenate dehydratase
MPSHHFFDIIRNMYSANVDGSVLPHEATHATHVISVIGMLVPSKDINIGVEHVVNPW